jgi:spectinomycin phosphotransferase
MNNTLKIDPQTILQTVQLEYGLAIQEMEFLLRGWGGDCFVAKTAEGIRYFLKFHDETEFLALAAGARDFYLPLMDQLHHKGILPHIPHPSPTLQGDFSLTIEPYELVITNFIEGHLVGFGRLPDPILIRLAELTGILHRSKSQLEFQHPFVDAFQINYEDLLVQSLDEIETITPADRPGKQALKNLVLPQKNLVLEILNRHKELQTFARATDKPTVVCHTDLHGANLMTDDQDNLFILDWENAMLAPPEHDLFFFVADERFGDLFFPAYQKHVGSMDLDVQFFEFYLYRRAFEDVTDFMVRILNGDGSQERDQEDLKEISGYLKGFKNIGETLAEIHERIESLT